TTSASTWVFEDLVLLDIETVQITHPTIGQSNGSIDINVSGSNPSFTYAWYTNLELFAETEDLVDVLAGTYQLIVTDSYGCTAEMWFTLTGISASHEAFSNAGWLISPNPSSGKFQLQAPAHTQGAVQWKVHDSRGKLVVEQTGALLNKSIEIDLGAVPAGVYFLEIQSGGKSAWERVVVQR
ncbi:MAG: T9SS type A sorting domain-containing protein, partial [Saprospiraceae bacterium]|nr:T9SS type A sorting domain-containing protein [Saprospiraceae bacterium]